MTVATSLAVRLETSCSEMCDQFSRPLLEQMGSGSYDQVSLMAIPEDVSEWRTLHKTARKRADRCSQRGYWFNQIARHQYSDDVYAINTSRPVRQKRPMASGYNLYPAFSPLPHYECARHAVRTYGVLASGGTLVAYLWLYRAGDLALVSQILGHDDYLKAEVMWLLWQGMLAAESAVAPFGFVVYNRHDSGTEGLRWYKEHVGLVETDVEWLP